jgi:hypothetical protein
MPGQPQLDKLLSEMLDAQGDPPAVRQKIMELADANKWEMVKGYQQLKAQRQRQQAEAEEQGLDRGDIKDTPEHWIQVLNLEPSRSNLDELAVMLRQREVTWVDDFISLQGVEALSELLELLEKKAFKKPGDFEMMGQVLRCLRSLMNLENGMDAVLGVGEGVSGGLRQLARCIDTKHESVHARTVQCQALTLLSAAALYSAEGHEQVLESLDHLKKTRRRMHRFGWLVEACNQGADDADAGDDLTFEDRPSPASSAKRTRTTTPRTRRARSAPRRCRWSRAASS